MPDKDKPKDTNRNLFLANITHEFRTPIQTMLATIDMLKETSLDPEQLEYIQQIHFSAEALLSLVNDFLDFSKLESGQFRFEYIPYNPLVLIEQTIDLLAIEAHNKSIEIISDIDFALPTQIIGDPTRTRQVLTNLLKNAVKFTQHGYIEISASADPAAKTISFFVKDTGIGISEEGKKKLFSNFYQTDASNTRKYGGTGLGLSISKQFVELMGGKIGMKDNPEGGSIFYFSLPYSLPEDMPEEVAALEPSVTEDEKVLIVDDRISAAQSFQKKLKQLGFKDVDYTLSGDDALKMLCEAADSKQPYSQVFIDMVMPVMDGWRLSSEINNNSKINSSKLYLLIPEGQMGRDAKMKRLKWFNGYLYKPIKKKQLINLLIANAEETLELEAVDDDTPVSAPQKETAPVPKPATETATGANSEKKPESSSEYEVIAKGRKIIIAEDHPVNQKLISRFFQQFGAETVCANNGEEAYKAATANPDADLIFMDIQMPVMSGVEATQKIRAKKIATPIIACTANTDEADFNEYYKAGMNDVLIKPFKKQTVYELLQKWIKKLDEEKNKDSGAGKPNAGISISSTAYNPIAWDIGEMLVTTRNNKELAKQMIADFLSQTVSIFEKITEAIQNNNFLCVQQYAHILKGSAGALAINKLSDTAKQMELIAKAENAQTCQICLEECGIYFDEFSKLAEDWIEENS
ncbi:MAG: response regulator [Spirochaetales bacterium]|nr:response regulator [Spirochaetales bacterium]